MSSDKALDEHIALKKPAVSVVNEAVGDASVASSTHDLPTEKAIEVDADLELDNPEVRQLLPEVKRVVSLHDDPSLPTLTFRYVLLSILFVVPGAFLSQMNIYRTAFAPYSVFFVQIASNYVGNWLARILPRRRVRIPLTSLAFELNPGPWSVKEHVLVTVTANSGAISNQGASALSIAELYFNQRIPAAASIFFMWGIVGIGYAYTAIARQVLLYDPAYPWFQALCQTALFETQKKQLQSPTRLAKKQMRIFWGVLLAVTLWQFLPEYAFPMVSSLAFLCWVAPRNATANFLGSGLGGMGFLNLSFDWANISNYNAGVPLFLSPWWSQVVLFSSFVFCCWILLPAAKFGGLGYYHHGLMTNRALRADGSRYPIADLITPQQTFNQSAYDANGPIYLGTQQLWSMFFDYASYVSGYAWILFFGFKDIRSAYRKFRERGKESGKGINHQYTDRLNVLMRSYKEVPLWWYAVLFVCCFFSILAIILSGYLYLPWWTYIVALLTGACTIIPLGWLYAVSNFQLPIGTFNELIYGVMIQATKSHHNPTGASFYGAIAGDAWYRAQYMLQDQKIGHYMHVSQRAIFASQVWGMLLGIPVNYAAMRWILSAKRDLLNGTTTDPTHIWTGQSLATGVTTGVQYVLIGPSRLFSEQIFRPLPYAFLVGAAVPAVLYSLHRTFPKARFDLWNSTIFFSGASIFYGNISTGYLSRFMGGFVVMFWYVRQLSGVSEEPRLTIVCRAYRYRYKLWSRYNFILAAAFDAGFNLNMLLIFLIFGSAKIISMPNWWGNNADSVERCFALES